MCIRCRLNDSYETADAQLYRVSKDVELHLQAQATRIALCSRRSSHRDQRFCVPVFTRGARKFRPTLSEGAV